VVRRRRRPEWNPVAVRETRFFVGRKRAGLEVHMSLGLRTVVKSAVAGVAHATGALRWLDGARRKAGGARVHVLGFHRIVESPDAIGPEVIPALCIGVDSFARLCALARERFEVLSLLDAVDVLGGQRRLARDAVVITFDDGYRDVYLRALPVLRSLGLPATVFVPTGHVGSPEPLLHDRLHALLARARVAHRDLCAAPGPRLLRVQLARAESVLYRRGVVPALETLIEALPAIALRRVAEAIEDLLGEAPQIDEGGLVMSADELRACVDGGIELGAHTVDHVVLVREPPARVRRELSRPRLDLEAIAGRPCRAFAYCNGLYSPSLVEAVADAGYVAAVTTADRPNRVGADPLLLGRKVMWEGHVRGVAGGFSKALAAAHLSDLFGALGVTRPVEGARPDADTRERIPWRRA
jgi:peptidoglycan/xylan/chitin deacetylase (PgdA/CDA1 family)